MRRRLLRLLALIAVFAVAGALAGVLWEWWWTPATGVAFHDEWLLDSEGVGRDFAGSGLFVIVTGATGLVLGVLCAALVRGDELWTVTGIVIGAVVAAFVTAAVGGWLGPPDPRPLAVGEEDFTALPSDLRVTGASPYLAAPMGALVGVVVIYLSGRRVARSPAGTRVRQLQS